MSKIQKLKIKTIDPNEIQSTNMNKKNQNKI